MDEERRLSGAVSRNLLTARGVPYDVLEEIEGKLHEST